MTPQVDNLRQRALENNLLWLESFGCQIKRYENLIYVNHPNMPDYCAWLIYGSPSEALNNLRSIFAESDPKRCLPDVYIDETAFDASIHSTLVENGFIATLVNMTTAGVITPKAEATDLRLQLADPDDATRWSAFYSEGFNRSGRRAEIDRVRWQLSFENENVRNWFVMNGRNPIGVCQTCVGFEVTGIYSLTLKTSERGLRQLRPALKALRNRLTEKNKVTVYFERLRREQSSGKQRGSLEFHELMAIRKMIGYRRF